MFISTNKIKHISRQDALDELSKLDLCDVEIPVSLALNKSYTICASDNYEEILEKYNKIKG